MYEKDVAEFVSEYVAIEPVDGEAATLKGIAAAFLESEPSTESLSDEEFDGEVEALAPQLAYYAPKLKLG